MRGKLYPARHLISESWFPHRLQECYVIARCQRVAAQIQRTRSRRHGVQRHQILPVGADIHHVVINRVFVGIDRPLQGIAGHARRHGKAVVDPGLDFRSFFVIIPSHQLQSIELIGRIMKAVDLVKGS